MAQQTAVEWLAEQLKEYDYEDFDSDYFEFKIPIWVFGEKVNKAKVMEKDQRQKDWDEGFEAATKSPDDVPLKISKTVTLNK